MLHAASPHTLRLAHLALMTANAIFGVGSVVSKIGLQGCNPVIFGLLREVLAAPLLFAMSVLLERGTSDSSSEQTLLHRSFTHLDVLQFLVAGALLFTTNLGFIIGVKLLGATSAAIWQSSLPVFTTLIAMAVGYESLTVLKASGVLMAFAGCAFITLYEPPSGDELSESSDPAASTTARLTGNLIFLVQVTALGAFFVAEKPLLARWTPLATLAYSYTIAAVLMLAAGILINASPTCAPPASIVAFARTVRHRLPLTRRDRCVSRARSLLEVVCPDCDGEGWGVPRSSWLAIAYWVLLGSVTTYLLLTWGNRYVDMVGVYFTIQPLAAVVAAVGVIAVTAPPHYGLVGPGMQDLGALGIVLGVAILIIDERRTRRRAGAAESDVHCSTTADHLPRGRLTNPAGDGSLDGDSAAEEQPPYQRLP